MLEWSDDRSRMFVEDLQRHTEEARIFAELERQRRTRRKAARRSKMRSIGATLRTILIDH
jgi:hypothetical protein